MASLTYCEYPHEIRMYPLQNTYGVGYLPSLYRNIQPLSIASEFVPCRMLLRVIRSALVVVSLCCKKPFRCSNFI